MMTIVQKMNTLDTIIVDILQNGIAAIESIAARRDQMMMSSHMCEMVLENLLRDIFVRRSSDWEKIVNLLFFFPLEGHHGNPRPRNVGIAGLWVSCA